MLRPLRFALFLLLPLAPALAQNVGIGTPAPTQTLDVNGSLRVRGLATPDKRLLQTLPDGTVQLSSPLLGAVATTTGSPAGLAISGGYLYVGMKGPSSLAVYSLANPAQPALVTTVATTITNVDALAAGGGYLYVCSNGSNSVEIFSLATPAAPTSAAVVNVGYLTDGVAVVGSVLYLADITNNRLQVLSLATPTAPTAVGYVATVAGPGQFAVAGSYLYAAMYGAGVVQTFSLATPTAPVSQGTVPAAADANGAAVLGTRIYVGTNTSNTLITYDLTAPAAPVQVATQAQAGLPYALAALGNYLYVANYSAKTVQALPLAAPNVLGFDNSGNLTAVPAATLGDNLGNHLATRTLALNNNWLSNTPGATSGLHLTNNNFVQMGTGTGGLGFGRLEVVNDNSGLGNADDVVVTNYTGTASGSSSLTFYNLRGSSSAYLPLGRNDRLGSVNFGGLLGSNTLYSLSSIQGFYRGNGLVTDLASELRFITSGTTRATLDTLGYLGLGTTAPYSRLSLTPGTVEPKITLWDGGLTTAHYGFGISGFQLNYHVIDNSASHVFYAGGKNGPEPGVSTELLRLTGTGYLGLGTGGAPASRLEVVADNSNGGSVDDVTLRSYGASAAPGIGQRRYRGTYAAPANLQTGDFLGEFGLSGYYNNAEGGFTLSGFTGTYQGNGTTALSDMRLITGGLERARIDASGRLGVGTGNNALTERVQVEGGSAFVNGESAGLLVDAGGLKRTGLVKYAGEYAGLWRISGADFKIGRVANTTALPGTPAATDLLPDLFIASTGQVGLGGITAPTAALEVRGTGSSSQIARVRVRSTNDQAGIGFVAATAGGTASTEAVIYQPQATSDMRLYVGNADRLSVTAAGQVGIGKQPAATETLDVEGSMRVGTAAIVGEVHTPLTGTSNMLAVAYGQMNSDGTTGNTSGNFTLANIGTGHCRLTFGAGTGLNAANFGALTVLITQTGTTASSASYVGGVGFLDVYTFNGANVATNNTFSVLVFRP